MTKTLWACWGRTVDKKIRLILPLSFCTLSRQPVMSSPALDPSLLQPTYTLPPALDPREPAPPPITSPGGHIQTSRNRSTGTPRTPRTPTRSPVRSAASSRATSPVMGGSRRERGSFGAAHPLQSAHGLGAQPQTGSRGASPAINSTSSSRRSSGPGMSLGVAPNSIDAALASSKSGPVSQNPHLPTSPLSEQGSPPISPLEGIAGPIKHSNAPPGRSRPLSGTTSPRARPSSHATSRLHTSGEHASAFLRPVSPALSATASISDSMIFERDIESPLPPSVPSSVLEQRPSSRKGSRASGLNAGHAGDHGHSLAHSQTHSYSNLHQHYTHGDFLDTKIPTVLDDAIEALTALSESEKLSANGIPGRTRLVDIEVESPMPVQLNWTSPSVPGRISHTATPQRPSHNGSRAASPSQSGVASPRQSNPTSPLLTADRPALVNRVSSVGPSLPGAFPSDEERSSESWRRKIQDWIGPKGIDDEPTTQSADKDDKLETQLQNLHVEKPEPVCCIPED